jgi:outer membrane receptor protein involved in Fe transport
VTVRGGYFSDNYFDTGIPNTTSVTWINPSFPSSTCPVCATLPPSLQQPTGYNNTPQAKISEADTTKTGLFQIDYNHAFNAAGSHMLKGGFGLRHTVNDVNVAYPGGYVRINWGATFTSLVPGVGQGTGTYGYYEVNDNGTRGAVNANMPSLYIQDAWTIGNRLTLNLGVRTESETVPSFRPSIQPEAFSFGYGDKLAPRLGASYDVTGDGKVKAFASWGRYYDWVKYELARGSFGGDIWNIYYRSLDTLDVYSLNLSNMPGKNLWDPSNPASYRDRRVPNFNTIDPNLKPMFQDATNAGVEFQVTPTTVFSATYIHNKLTRTIEDVGSLDANGNEVYFAANPGEGVATTMYSTGLTPPTPTPKPLRQYDALEMSLSRRFSSGWFASANVTISRLYGNYAGLANSDEITTPTTGVGSSTAQQQAVSIARPGSAAGRAWDLDELEWDSHGNLNVLGRLATDRPVVAKLYGSYAFPFGTQIGAFEYIGSGTPMSTYVNSTNQIPIFVNGRGDMGRTPMLSRTDLLLSHEFAAARNHKFRLELNVVNLFNQKTPTHLFNCLNRGCGVARQDAAISLAQTDLSKGYDYNKLILATPLGANAYDPRYGQPDLWQTGTQGQFSVKYTF